MVDYISRQSAIRWVKTECNPYGKPTLDFESGKKVIEHLKQMPSAQPDLIDKIQNGINATNANDNYSCGMRNGMRWCMSLVDDKEPSFEECPSAQPEIIRCKDCKKREHCRTTNTWAVAPSDDWYCADAERRGKQDEH